MGVVYFVKANNHIKIGYTENNINKRLKNLQAGSAETLILEGLIKNANKHDEKKLHHLFADERQHGEWFHLSNRLKYFIELISREIFESKINDINAIYPPSSSLHAVIEEHEKTFIMKALKDCHNIKSKAAKILGINRSLMHYKMKKYNLL